MLEGRAFEAEGSLAGLRAAYLRLLLAGHRREAVRLVVDEGLRVATIAELQHDVIGAAQEEIGQLWLRNQVSVAQEHMATAISQLTLAALFERARAVAPLDRKLLIACVEGELHELPARLVADYLQLGGFEVKYLGANVPTDHLIMMVHAERPDLVGLSVTTGFNLTALRDAVTRLRAFRDVPILVGGRALGQAPTLARELCVHTAGSRPAELVAAARRLTGPTPSQPAAP